ncbi:MAG TPA: hypothetical protein VD836_04510 [Solirubrobacteraceae bacterium]|nr:hypothetical protein [Solirubrobacteraceae bacterium]
MTRAALIAAGLAVASTLVVAAVPSYDPWAWLLWGREVAGGTLSTAEGPAFKPLPVAVCALLSPLGDAAPWVWVTLVRVAAAVGAVLAFGLARRLAGGSKLAGALAALGVLLCGALPAMTAAGADPALVIALALGAATAWSAGRPGLALALGAACGLVRVETWPFLLAAAAVAWRREPRLRAPIAAAAVLVPAAWFVPELLGSGDALRSSDRAQIPNPGQPALADVPFLASLEDAAGLPLWPLWVGVAVLAAAAVRARRATPALLPAAAGAAWLAIVALMAEAGFSGEARYAVPGAAMLAISGAVGLALVARRHAVAAIAVVAAVGAAALPRLDDVEGIRREQAHQRALADQLATVLTAAGGREAVLACGRPYVGRLRGPLMAYRMGVEKRHVEPDLPPHAPGMVFRSRLHPGDPVLPAAVPGGFVEVARSAEWQVLAACT